MARGMLSLVAICLALAPTVRNQQAETYTINIKEAGQGESYLFKNTIKIDAINKVTDTKGNPIIEQAQKKVFSTAYKATILEKAAGQPFTSSMKRAYEKATSTVDGESRSLPFDGKSVLITKKGDAYQFHEVGVELPAKDAAELDHELNGTVRGFVQDKDVMPKLPVRLNDAWSIDATGFIANSGAEGMYDPAKTKITGKLVKVYQKNKAQYGVIEIDILLVTKAGFGGGIGDFEILEGQMSLKMTVDACIDGTSFARTNKSTGIAESRGAGTIDGAKLLMNGHITYALEESREDVAKK